MGRTATSSFGTSRYSSPRPSHPPKSLTRALALACLTQTLPAPFQKPASRTRTGPCPTPHVAWDARSFVCVVESRRPVPRHLLPRQEGAAVVHPCMLPPPPTPRPTPTPPSRPCPGLSRDDDETHKRSCPPLSGACQTGTLLATLSAHTETVTAVVWLPDGRHFVTGSLDKSILCWVRRITSTRRGRDMRGI